jgi:drug/metabolite transporter (DMT)-like permease
MVTLLGVMIVIFNGDGATAAPTGNVLFGGFLGLMSALGLAVVFVFIRKSPNVPILLAVALGNILSGIIGFAGVSVGSLFSGSLWPVLLMGFGVMPLAMALLSTAPRYTAPTNVTLFMLLEMVLGPIWVWLGTGEQPSFMMIFGAAIVLATLIIYILSSVKNET